jgi:glutathione S-transferase
VKLYTFAQAANPRKVQIYLTEKQIDLDTVEVTMPEDTHIQRDYLAKNPMAAVPILELDDGRTLTEADAIIEYLEELHPEPTLLGRDPWTRALTREVMTMAERGLLDTALLAIEHSSEEYADQISQVPAVAEHAKARFANVVTLFDNLLVHHEYLAGNRFTVADITAFVGLEFGAAGGCLVPSDAKNIAAWFKKVAARAST